MNKKQTVEEIVREFSDEYRFGDGEEYLQDWLRTKLQSLQSEKEEMMRDFEAVRGIATREKLSGEVNMEVADILNKIAQKHGIDLLTNGE